MSKISRGGLGPTALCSSVLALVAVGALASAGQAQAQDGHPTAEGSSADELVVTAERNKAAATAPTKGSITETQPESIISSQFIQQVVPATGDYTSVVLIAPSIGGIPSNGGGVGETNKATLRGFQDGQYNITYDGIFYGDTNDPTHHPASFFPASTIGTAVVDRGPGAAGDLGQANYGGALHYFSPDVSSAFGIRQNATFGSYNTRAFVTTIQSGEISQLDHAKILLNFDERLSDGELSYSSGKAFNQLAKIQAPVGSNGTLTLFAAYNYTRFYQSDAGPGETWQQVQLYGKDFALTNDPNDEHYWGYNHQAKRSDFEYIDYKGAFADGVSVENQGYTYFYSNKTISVDDITGLVGGTNTSHPADKLLPQTDIGGYDKGNRYRVFGDIMRVNKNWAWGTLKAGGMVETSSTDRHNLLIDLTQDGAPDLKYSSLTTPVVKNVSNVKTLEDSSWFQYQLFADLELRPMDNLTITPGFKYVHLKRDVNAVMENSGISGLVRGPLVGTDTFEKPLYFLTANYRIQPDWSMYFQYATGFLIPSLSALYVNNISLNQLQPTTTVNYQAGSVYSHGNFSVDADVYKIDVKNLQVADPTGQFYVNQGDGSYYGVEGEAAVALPMDVTLFANGSLNRNRVGGQEVTNAPSWTAATGALYHHGPWGASLTFKQVGRLVAFYNGGTATVTPDGVALAPGQARKIGPYSTTDASISYDFGHFRVKLAGFNLFDNRTITSITGPAAKDLYTFQAGRQIQGTIEAKF
jgi:iron complex outermembrane recepter protein